MKEKEEEEKTNGLPNGNIRLSIIRRWESVRWFLSLSMHIPILPCMLRICYQEDWVIVWQMKLKRHFRFDWYRWHIVIFFRLLSRISSEEQKKKTKSVTSDWFDSDVRVGELSKEKGLKVCFIQIYSNWFFKTNWSVNDCCIQSNTLAMTNHLFQSIKNASDKWSRRKYRCFVYRWRKSSIDWTLSFSNDALIRTISHRSIWHRCSLEYTRMQPTKNIPWISSKKNQIDLTRLINLSFDGWMTETKY